MQLTKEEVEARLTEEIKKRRYIEEGIQLELETSIRMETGNLCTRGCND